VSTTKLLVPKRHVRQHGENGIDATRGEPLALRAQKRKAELEVALQKLPEDELRARNDIALELTSVDALLIGDLEHLSDAKAFELSRWLEHTKHLAEATPSARRPPGTSVAASCGASGQATKEIDMATGTGDPADGTPEAAREHRALAWAAAASLAVMFWLVRPIGLGILVGTLLAFLAQPACQRLAARIGARWAVLTTVIVSGFAAAVTLGGLGWLFVSRGTVLATRLVAAVGPLGFVDSVLTRAGGFTARFGVSSDQLRDHVRGLAIDAASSAEHIAAAIASTTASALVGLLFAMLAMHYILRNEERVSGRIADVVPLRPTYTMALVAEFRRVGRATLFGSVVTGVVQGGFATIGFWIAGVPEPLFFGAATALASFVPVVGVLLVIVPTSIGLAVTGYVVSALIALGWGLVFVVGVSDYVIRPRLVRGEAKVPSIVTLAALLGGVEVLGLQGLLVGPVLMALALAVLQLYAAETRARRHLDA
jgi:predicted PurR-regulated permease PerM